MIDYMGRISRYQKQLSQAESQQEKNNLQYTINLEKESMDLQFERWFNRQNESLQEAFALIAAIHGLNVAKERCEELGENWNKFKNAAIMAVREISFLP